MPFKKKEKKVEAEVEEKKELQETPDLTDVSKWSVQQFRQVPTEEVIFNKEDGKAYTVLEALAELLNRTEE